MGIIVIPLMTIVLMLKTNKEYKETQQLNIIRCYMICIFAAFSWALFWANLYESTHLLDWMPPEIIANQIFTINIYSIGVGLMVTFAVSMIAYANRWDVLYYTSFFFFIGFMLFYILTGFDAWFQYYIYITAALGLIFFYITGFRLKDNSTLGLGFFFTIAFLALVLGESIPGQIASIGFSTFAIIFVLGYFKPFKEETKVMPK
jgi:hypothetical protein